METFRSRYCIPAASALALLATPSNAEGKETKNLIVDKAVTLSCPNAAPVNVTGNRLEISEQCRSGVLRIECAGAKVLGEQDFKPDPIIHQGKQLGVSLPVSRLDGQTIEVQCKKDTRSGRAISVSFQKPKPQPPQRPAQAAEEDNPKAPVRQVKAPPTQIVAQPKAPMPTREKTHGLFRSVGAGVEASFFSNGDDMVGMPGFFVNSRLGVLFRNAALDVEAGYVPLAQKVGAGPGYLPRNPGQRLKGGMGIISAGVGGKIWNVLHGGVGVGVGIVRIEEGQDIAVARTPDENGRRALANLPQLTALHPLARAELAVVFDVRDDVSLALGGRATWTISVMQTKAGEGDNDRVPLLDASAFAAAQYNFE